MNTAKLSTDGTHQVVILPEDFQLTGTEVYIEKIGTARLSNTVLLKIIVE